MRASALVVALVLVGVMLVSPANTYTTGVVDRSAALGVAADENAAVGLDQPSTDGESVGELVTITNNFETTKTFTVTLQTNRDRYDVYRAGEFLSAEDSVSVTVEPGGRATISYRTPIFGFVPPNGDARFSVETSGGVSVQLSRVRSIRDGRQRQGGQGNGNGRGNPPGNACDNPGNGNPGVCQ